MQKKKESFYHPEQSHWDEAVISSGVYGTRNYFSKTYYSKPGLAKWMRALGYKSKHPYSGETWNHGSKQYKINFYYN